MAIASLAPLAGFVILVAGEAVRLARLSGANRPYGNFAGVGWRRALRSEALKWCLLLTMIVFTITVKDAVADVLIGASVLVWLALNAGSLFRAQR